MARQALIRDPDFPYHVVNRSNNRDFFDLDLELLWRIFVQNMGTLIADYQCDIHAFVLMSNHYHLLLSSRDGNIDRAMQYLQRETARTANLRSGRTNHFFGTRYRWSIIRTENYYWNSVKYIFRNPVRAGLCERVEDYKFSSLNRRIDKWNSPLVFSGLNPTDACLQWLNEPFQNESEELIRRALRRKEFRVPRTSKVRKATLDATPYKK